VDEFFADFYQRATGSLENRVERQSREAFA